MNAIPSSVQPDTEQEVLGVRDPSPHLHPNCSCIDRLNGYLRQFNGRLGTKGIGTTATPIVFVRRLDPIGEQPPVLLPRFCPFCGDPFSGQKPRKAGAHPDAADAPASMGPVEAAIFVLLRAQQLTVLGAKQLVEQAAERVGRSPAELDNNLLRSG